MDSQKFFVTSETLYTLGFCKYQAVLKRKGCTIAKVDWSEDLTLEDLLSSLDSLVARHFKETLVFDVATLSKSFHDWKDYVTR
jgi:predicted site-specific integrase-resolvase